MSDTMRLSGLTSGFDTESMIKQLMSSYQTKIDKQNQKLQKLSWQQAGYQDITKKITEFKNKYFDVLKRDTYLMSASTFNKFTSGVTATNGADTSGLSVSTTSNSAAGSYKVRLNQRASAARASGNSITMEKFALDFDKAISAGGTDVTNDDGSVTRKFELSLSFKVGSVSKTIDFSAEAALDASGNISDAGALKSDMLDALNTKLQEGFGYSGRTGADATGSVDASGNEWFIQAEMGANGKVSFNVGGNATASVTESKGNFGLAQAASKVAISTSSVVTGTNIFTVDIGGKSVNVDFQGVSSTYYDSRNSAGNETILAEFNQLKAAAYRKDKGLSAGATVTQTQLDSYTYSSEQAAKDRNASAIKSALGAALPDYKFTLDGSYLTAKDKNGNDAEFAMTSVEGGTLGIARETVSNKATSGTKLSAMGLTPDADGKYTLTINDVDITVDKDATVANLMSAVNKSDANVTMTYSSLTNSFTVESKEMGGAGKVDIRSSDVTKALGIADDNGTVGFTSGQNSVFEINGQEIYLNDNSYTLDGTTFTFNDNMEVGETYTATISKDSTTVKDTVKKFVEDYNQLIEDVYGYIGTAPAKDSNGDPYDPLTDDERDEMSEDEITKWEEKAKQGVLYNDSTVSTIMSQIRTTLYNSVTLDDGTKFGIYSMGIKTSSEWSEHGKLEIDDDAFDKAFENNQDAIVKLFTDSENGVMAKVNKVMDSAVKSSGKVETRGTLVRKAGKENSSVTTDSTIYKEMKRIQERMSDLQTKYSEKEEYWWKVFTNMESALSDLNSQTSYISSYFGTSGNYQ